MKKIFTILSLVLMASSTFGSDVLFKMVSISSSAVSCTNEEKDLSPYAVVIGGDAKVGTTSESAKSLVVMQSSSSYVRLDGGYLRVTLPRALKAGDQIYFTTYGEETKTLYLTNNTTRSHWTGESENAISPATTFTVTNTLATYSTRLNNSTDLYFHYGADNAPYIKSLVITSDDDANVKDYLFDGLDAVTYSEATTDIFGGDIVVHSTSNSAAIQALNGTNVFYSNGNGKGKELEIKVTAPCNIEIYAAIASNAVAGRKLHLSDANNNSSALIKEGTEIYSIVEGDKGKIVKIKAEYNGLEAKSLYLSSSAGSWQVAAIRVVNKVLPVIAGNSGSLNSSKTIWTSTTGNITVAEEAATTDAIKKESNAIMNFSDKSSDNVLRLMGSSKTYKVSVPSNKSIVSAYIEACANGASTSDAKLKVNGGSWTTLSYSGNSTEPIIFTPTINASSFTIETNSRAAQVQIKLVLTDIGYYPVSISGGWASFCAPEDVEIPEGVYAYVGNVVTDEVEGDDVLTINKVESNKIPANEGVLLYSDVDGDYELTSTTGAPVIEHNIFVGTVARTANPNTSTTYSLYDNAGTIEFWNYTGNYIPANKAYLVYGGGSAGAPAKKLRVQVAPKMPTAIDEVQTTKAQSIKRFENGQLVIIRDGVKYNVQGQIVK